MRCWLVGASPNVASRKKCVVGTAETHSSHATIDFRSGLLALIGYDCNAFQYITLLKCHSVLTTIHHSPSSHTLDRSILYPPLIAPQRSAVSVTVRTAAVSALTVIRGNNVGYCTPCRIDEVHLPSNTLNLTSAFTSPAAHPFSLHHEPHHPQPSRPATFSPLQTFPSRQTPPSPSSPRNRHFPTRLGTRFFPPPFPSSHPATIPSRTSSQCGFDTRPNLWYERM